MNLKQTWANFKGEHTYDIEGSVQYGPLYCMKTPIGEITVTPITRGQWEEVLPSKSEWERTWMNEAFEHALPATNVTLHDIAKFISRFENRYGVRFRLPTSGEHYTMAMTDFLRAGGRRILADPNALGTFAWQPFMQPVAMGTRTDWGLYDTFGCVWQWCGDETEDVSVVQVGGTIYRYPQRPIFGGSWKYRAKDVLPSILGGRNGYKFNAHAEVSGNDVGFRLIRVSQNDTGNDGGSASGSVDERRD